MTKKFQKHCSYFNAFYFKQICPVMVNSATWNSLEKVKVHPFENIVSLFDKMLL